MTITKEGARGTAGCNEWGSDAVGVSWGSLDLGDVVIAQVACPNANLARIEQLFYEAIWQVDRIRFDGERIVLSGPGGEIVLERGAVDLLSGADRG